MRATAMTIIILLGSLMTGATFAQENAGEEDLQKATDLKLSASTAREFDEIADLCESAIEKGLDDESEAFTKRLWVSTLYEHAELYTEKIFRGEYGRRWQPYRRQAVIRLETALELDPEFLDGHVLLARLNTELPGGNEESARGSLDSIIELAGEDKQKQAEAYMLKARMAEDNDDKLEALNSAIEADPENIDARRLRGAIFMIQEKSEEALDDFKKVAETESDADTYAIVAQILIGLERYDEAIEFTDNCLLYTSPSPRDRTRSRMPSSA